MAPAARWCGRNGVHAGGRPERVGKIKLRVGQLPEQKIADALLATGADEQVGFGRIGHGQMRRQVGFAVMADFFRMGQRQLVDGLQDIPAATVVGGDGQGQPGIVGGQRLAFANQRQQARFECHQIANHPQPHAIGMEPTDLALQRTDEQVHQKGHFLHRPAPVFRRKGEQGQVADVARNAGLDQRTHRLDATLVAGDTRQEAFLGPASVAIHDDRQMARHVAYIGYRLRRTGELSRHDTPFSDQASD